MGGGGRRPGRRPFVPGRGVQGRDGLHPPEHPLAHHGVRDEGGRELHRLLVGDAAGEAGHLVRSRSNLVRRKDPIGVAHRGVTGSLTGPL